VKPWAEAGRWATPATRPKLATSTSPADTLAFLMTLFMYPERRALTAAPTDEGARTGARAGVT
jgi:hypothetical protein